MFSEIKHLHFKLRPQGQGGISETLIEFSKGATAGGEACNILVAGRWVRLCFDTD